MSKVIGTKFDKLTEEIIRIFYKVYNTLGYGFLEKVYENAMMIEFAKAKIPATPQSLLTPLMTDKP